MAARRKVDKEPWRDVAKILQNLSQLPALQLLLYGRQKPPH